MYWLSRRTRISRADVLGFVLRDEQFPRACLFCLKQIELFLRALPHSAKALDTLAVVCGFLSDVELGTREQIVLHELIDLLQLHVNGVHAEIAQTYFQAPVDAGTMRQLQQPDTSRALPA
jgi:uncharacterized alpha-E superfamily protein